jgi:lactate dehydrogenase-like 2-hydroxyacid dehydrogenase
MLESVYLMGAAELAMMKRTAILVNTARGPVVNEQALVDALKAGGIAALTGRIPPNLLNPRVLEKKWL